MQFLVITIIDNAIFQSEHLLITLFNLIHFADQLGTVLLKHLRKL